MVASMLLQMVLFRSFLWLNNIPFLCPWIFSLLPCLEFWSQNYFFKKRQKWGIPIVVPAEMNQTSIHEDGVLSLASISGSGI